MPHLFQRESISAAKRGGGIENQQPVDTRLIQIRAQTVSSRGT